MNDIFASPPELVEQLLDSKWRAQTGRGGIYLFRKRSLPELMANLHGFHLAKLDHGVGPPTMLCGFVGNLQLCLNGPEAPRDSEWTSYLRSSIPYGNAVTIGLAHTLGGGPNPAQRQETTRFRRTEAPVSVKTAVLTDVAFHRAFIRVVNLFETVPFRAFSSRDLRKALAYLDASIPEAEVRRHFAYMAGLLGIAGYDLPRTGGSELSSLE